MLSISFSTHFFLSCHHQSPPPTTELSLTLTLDLCPAGRVVPGVFWSYLCLPLMITTVEYKMYQSTITGSDWLSEQIHWHRERLDIHVMNHCHHVLYIYFLYKFNYYARLCTYILYYYTDSTIMLDCVHLCRNMRTQ